jgi:site-specific DNA-methyltransferase (adenine-specific)
MEINKIYNENCLDTMKRMPGNFIDLTVTSPPYDGLRTYKGYSFPFEDIAKELYRITKQGGVVVWVVGDAVENGSETGTSFKQALYFMRCGFNLHDTMIYEKQNPMPVQLNGNRYAQCFEYMFVFSKGKPKTANLITTTTTTIKRGWRYDVDGKKKQINGNVNEVKVINNIFAYAVGAFGNKDDKTMHPASFPELLAFHQIKTWSNENDIVYDCFMGSGTTAKAAIAANRKYIGSEISKEYYDIIQKRLQPMLHNLFS